MKTLTSLILLLLLTTGAYAKHDGNVLKAFSKKIKNNISMPQSLKQKTSEQKITVYFTVNECGEVVEINAKTRNKEAKLDIENQFRKLNFKGLQPGIFTSIDLSFVVY